MSENNTPERQGKRKNQYDSPNYKNCGRKPDQRMKSFIILALLWKYSDENHELAAHELRDLANSFSIKTERRSIYRDIKDINRALLALEEETGIYAIDDILDEEGNDELLPIIYDPHKKGYYFKLRPFDFYDAQMLAQCVCSAKFVSKSRSERLIGMIGNFVSSYQSDQIEQTSFLIDSEKTGSSSAAYSIATINDAMSPSLNGETHIAEKISFEHLEYVIDEMAGKPVLRISGKKIANPFQLLTKDGDIYLLSYDDSSEKMETYRVSRMTNVSLTGEARTGELIFKDMDLEAYYRNGFAVYATEPQHVTLQFQNRHLDAAVERFGTEKAKYSKSGSDHFTVDIDTEIGSSLYNWLLTFGTEAKILKPEWAAEAFLKHIDNIKNTYITKP